MNIQSKKKILVVQYSQTGQLARAAEALIAPLLGSDSIIVDRIFLEPVKPYSFPWKFIDFLDTFPEAVYLDPPDIKPVHVDDEKKYDLVILAYQIWFLAPSLPVTAFLKGDEAKQILQGTPVITFIACRNMWVMAQNAVVQLLKNAGARLLDNVVLIDQGSSMASFVTTPRWMFTGKKDAFWRFPPAGVSEHEIRNAARFGRALDYALKIDAEKGDEPLLRGLKAVEADYGLIQSETIGYRSFKIWGKLLRKIGPPNSFLRRKVLLVYFVFLTLMIITVVPISIILKRILSLFFKEKYKQKKFYYELPSGSGDERMEEFSEIN